MRSVTVVKFYFCVSRRGGLLHAWAAWWAAWWATACAGVRKYSTPIDVWSVGCIMAELLTKETLFPGKAEFDQISRIFKLLGAPTPETWPGASALPHMQKARH